MVNIYAEEGTISSDLNSWRFELGLEVGVGMGWHSRQVKTTGTEASKWKNTSCFVWSRVQVESQQERR